MKSLKVGKGVYKTIYHHFAYLIHILPNIFMYFKTLYQYQLSLSGKILLMGSSVVCQNVELLIIVDPPVSRSFGSVDLNVRAHCIITTTAAAATTIVISFLFLSCSCSSS
jgi:hypothetical protein